MRGEGERLLEAVIEGQTILVRATHVACPKGVRRGIAPRSLLFVNVLEWPDIAALPLVHSIAFDLHALAGPRTPQAPPTVTSIHSLLMLCITQPERDMLRLQGFFNHRHQALSHTLQVSRITACRTEGGKHLSGIISAAVEGASDEVLHAMAQRIEEDRDSQGGDGHSQLGVLSDNPLEGAWRVMTLPI